MHHLIVDPIIVAAGAVTDDSDRVLGEANHNVCTE
jgi:hypothetical protein